MSLPKGIFYKQPHHKAPDFVKGSISLKRAEVIQWLQSLSDEWVNLDLKISKDGKPYVDVNDWKPDNKPAKSVEIPSDFDDANSGLPF